MVVKFTFKRVVERAETRNRRLYWPTFVWSEVKSFVAIRRGLTTFPSARFPPRTNTLRETNNKSTELQIGLLQTINIVMLNVAILRIQN